MALSPTIIKNEISKITDMESMLFEGFPDTNAATATRWSDAVKIYASSVVPPSMGANDAAASFESIMSAVNADLANFMPLSITAFASFAAILGTGMAPAFIATPPATPINLAVVIPVGIAGGTADTIATTMAAIIDTWFRTGLAVPSVGGAAIPWS